MSQKTMTESSPKVSIVLPTYNGSRYIRQSIDGCLNQTHENIELIIVDDGSTDETHEIIKSYKDERIKYLKHENNKGLPHALNSGFEKADGEYLTWTSDDNYYDEKSIEQMLSFLKEKKCSFVYCDFHRFDDQNPSNLEIIRLPDVPELENINDVGPCFLYSKNVKEAVGEYDPETALAEDYDYWIRVSKKFSMYHLAETLYFYREHGQSLTSTRLCEVRIVDVLVRVKNEVLDINRAVDPIIVIVAREYPGVFKINKFILKILLAKKMSKVLEKFKMRKITFTDAKLMLGEISNISEK